METLIVFSGTYLAYVVVAIAAVAWIPSRKHTDIRVYATTALAIGIGALAALAAGSLYMHPQPFAVEGFEPLIPHDTGNAFPSHHTLAAGLAASIVFFFNRRLSIVLFLGAAMVGWGRIAVGLHYPVDVAASLVIAVLAVYLACLVVSHTPAIVLKLGDTPDHERGQ